MYDSIIVGLLLFLGTDIWGSFAGLGFGGPVGATELEEIGMEVLGAGTAATTGGCVAGFSGTFCVACFSANLWARVLHFSPRSGLIS